MLPDLISLIFLVTTCFSCEQEQAEIPVPINNFETEPLRKAVVPMVLETSGIADSKSQPGHLWAQEDSGNPTEIILLAHDGSVKKKVFLKGTVNRDWEDMTLSGNDIYVADIGDNQQIFDSYNIYQFTEPAAAVDTVESIKTIRFKYPDKSHDAEAFLVDAGTKDIYIITKRDDTALIYRLAHPYSYTDMNTPVLVGELPYTGVVSAAQSPDGSEIIIKTYTNLYHYTREAGQPLEEALKKSFTSLAYVLEPQGEAVTFSNDNKGFFTLSEKGMGTMVNLYFYRRK
ncbi:putative lipoprotein [Flammeovirgaceae bacterium 311]|nr:putative lipoprotein [Flammeovirgaceae bacterium 311]